MIALIQRVRSAQVLVADEIVGAIGPGLLVFACVQPGDTPTRIERMAERLIAYRVFPDASGRMNLGLKDTGGGLLLVSQFTLGADTRSGLRPGFSTAAPPDEARAGSMPCCRLAGQSFRWLKPGASAWTCRWHWSMRGRRPSGSRPDR